MLKKLFIHEWKDSWRLVAIVNLVVLGIALIGTVLFRSGAWEQAGTNEYIAMTVSLYMTFYVISICSLGLIVSVYFYLRFYHNLYTDQGYLMHTLPVTQHELIWSKALVAFLWEVISLVVLGVALVAVVDSCVASVGTNLWAELAELVEELDINGGFVINIIEYLVLMLLSVFMSIFMGYAAVSIGQLFKKNRLLGACGVYIGLYMLMQSLVSYVGVVFSLLDVDTLEIIRRMSEKNFRIVVLLIMIIVVGGVATAFYFITHNIMKNKLNLE